MDAMDVTEFINKRKVAVLSGGSGTIGLRKTYAHIPQIFTVEKLGCACHLLPCASTRDVNASAKKQWTGFKFTSLFWQMQHVLDSLVKQLKTNRIPPHQKGIIKSSIYLSVVLDK